MERAVEIVLTVYAGLGVAVLIGLGIAVAHAVFDRGRR